jgi:hypothetical protein
MRKLSLVILAVLMGVSAAVAADFGTTSSEFGVSPQYFMPGSTRFELYSMGYGVEAQYRYWFFEPFGVAFSVGAANYEVDSDSEDFKPIRVDGGSMVLLPVGPSLMLRIFDRDTWTLTLEGGIRYVLVNSDLKLASGSEVSVDNGVIGVLMLNSDWYLSDALSVFVGLGHYDDIAKGEVDGGRMRNNELESFVFNAGLRFRF